MTTSLRSKALKLITLYKYYLLIGIGLLVIAFLCIRRAFHLYYTLDETDPHHICQEKLADFLMTFGETIIIAGLLGGVIGGSINYIFEKLKKEEEEKKERKKDLDETREKQKLFQREMRSNLQHVHDNVELARILIKSHRSGKTYGEQIRGKIMPSLISLLDFKRKLKHVESRSLKKNLPYLEVSLRYMIAYLTVLIEEFESNYLTISNLQNYQDALAGKMRILYTEIAEAKIKGVKSIEKKETFLEKAEEWFDNTDVPPTIEVVWKAIEELDYVWDFIRELRNEKGIRSLYSQYFLQHYAHCRKILRAKDSGVNQKMIGRKYFKDNMKELQRIEDKKNSDQPLTNRDSLTRKIMETELQFDFEHGKMKPSS